MGNLKVMDKILISLVVVVAVLALVAVIQDATAATRWPKTFSVNGAAVGDTSYTLPADVGVQLVDNRPVTFTLAITTTGAHALPNLMSWSALADGAGAKVRFLNLVNNATFADSLYVDSMGSATTIFVFGE